MPLASTAQERFRIAVREELAPGLRRLGFAGSGARYELPSTTHWLVLGIQKSVASTATAVHFTVNLKAVSRAEWEQVRQQKPWAKEKPDGSSMDGSAHERLGILVSGIDTWWRVDATDASDDVGDVLRLIETHAVPWLRERELSVGP